MNVEFRSKMPVNFVIHNSLFLVRYLINIFLKQKLNIVNRIFFIILLSFIVLSTKAQRQWIATVDPVTVAITKIDSIPGIRYLKQGTYNQTTKEFTIIGSHDQQQSPWFLITIDAVSGTVMLNPSISNPNTFLIIKHSSSMGILYGIVQENNVAYLASIDKFTGNYTIISGIAGISGINSATMDEVNHRMLLAADGNHKLLSIDLITGNIIHNVAIQNISSICFDNGSQTLYGVAIVNGPTPGSFVANTCSVDPATGNTTMLTGFPAIEGLFSAPYETFNEQDHLYYFGAREQNPGTLLYSVNVNTGNLASNPVIPTSGVIDYDNLVLFNYDNNSHKMYAMFWEAHTVDPPPPPPVIVIPVDSSCRMDVQTKVYSKASGHVLVVDKKVTTCKVAMTVYNMAGQLMLKNIIVNDGYNEIPLSNFSTGIYYYKFIAEGKVLLAGRFLKQ